MSTMKAAVIHEAGGPEVLKIESLPIPTPQAGEVLIRIKAFGLNRSELFTRQGHSPGVKFPRVLGIEAVGIVEEAPGSEFRKGDIVATAMGGMGRQFDGGYAEYTCVPAKQVQLIKTGPRLGDARRHPGDAADVMGLAVQVASSRKGRTSADPRRHDIRRAGGCVDRQEPRCLRRGDDSQPRTQ
jgi:threonine dehydrogenase-like Zn-dependent dehydrogenase